VRGTNLMRQTGFTLIEILVTIAVVAVLSTMLVFVASPSAATQARTEARRLAALLELAIGEARASGQSIAWAPVPGGYAFFRRAEDGAWVAIADDSVYRRRALPDGVLLRDVTVEAHLLRDGERIVMTPYGLAGAIAATVSAGEASFTLRAGPLGRVSLVPVQARDDARTRFERPRLHVG
jgi:type II secretion system protein H